MPSNIFQNKLVLLLLVVIIAGAVITVATLVSGANKNITVDPNNAQFYDSLNTEISQLLNKPWDKFTYNDLKNRIVSSASANPSPLITGTQKQQLLDRLDAGYFLLLKAAVEQFCRTADPASAKTGDLTSALGAFPPGFQQQSIADLAHSLQRFRSINADRTSIGQYVTTSAYNQQTSDGYVAQIDAITHDVNLKDNSMVKSMAGEEVKELTVLRDHDQLLNKLETDGLLATYDCDGFRPNEYYINLCTQKKNNLSH